MLKQQAGTKDKEYGTKEVKQNLEQCSARAIAGVAIAVANLEQRQRKFSMGNLQDFDLQFPNLTHACPRLLLTLIFSIKRGAQHIERRQGVILKKIKKEKKETMISQDRRVVTSRAVWIQSSLFFACSFLYSLIEPMYFMTISLLFAYVFLSMN